MNNYEIEMMKKQIEKMQLENEALIEKGNRLNRSIDSMYEELKLEHSLVSAVREIQELLTVDETWFEHKV